MARIRSMMRRNEQSQQQPAMMSLSHRTLSLPRSWTPNTYSNGLIPVFSCVFCLPPVWAEVQISSSRLHAEAYSQERVQCSCKILLQQVGHLIPLVTSFCYIAIVCRRQVDKSNTPYPAATVPRAKSTPVKVLIWYVSNLRFFRMHF